MKTELELKGEIFDILEQQDMLKMQIQQLENIKRKKIEELTEVRRNGKKEEETGN